MKWMAKGSDVRRRKLKKKLVHSQETDNLGVDVIPANKTSGAKALDFEREVQE
jgi:hypothetical protein